MTIPPENGQPENITATVTEVSERMSTLVREEIELAKAEMTEKVTSIARGAAAVAAGAVFGVFAVAVAMNALAWGINAIVVDGAGNLWIGFTVVTGLLFVMAWSLGLGLLFTYLYKGSAQLAIGILFGQIFGITSQEVAVTFVAGFLTVLALVAVYRPLLFSTLDEEVAEAKGVPVRGLSIAFMVILAVAVSEAVQVVGVLLIFALIVAPAAIAERFTTRPSRGLIKSQRYLMPDVCHRCIVKGLEAGGAPLAVLKGRLGGPLKG